MNAPIIRVLRTSHWLKNLIIFAPLVFARHFELADIWRTLEIFILFCLLASGVYIINDIFDRKADAEHPRKRHRPIASGELGVSGATALALLLVGVSLLWILARWPGVFQIFSAYFLVQLLYSAWLRHVVILDVIAIAVGFLLRVWAGALVIGVPVSHWLASAAFLLALLLVFAKRYQELAALGEGSAPSRLALESYSPDFLRGLIILSAAGTLVSYMLYAADPETAARFGTDALIYTDLFVAFGIFRFLYHVYRRDLPDNPLEIIFKDWYLLGAILFWGVLSLAIIY